MQTGYVCITVIVSLVMPTDEAPDHTITQSDMQQVLLTCLCILYILTLTQPKQHDNRFPTLIAPTK